MMPERGARYAQLHDDKFHENVYLSIEIREIFTRKFELTIKKYRV